MPRNIERDKREADRRKNQLIEAGFRLFSQNGIETVSLQKVADAANVSPATMYKYFLTKEKLLIAISAKVWDEVWQEALGDPGTNHFEHFTAYQGIEFYADRMIALYKNRPEVLRFSGEYKTYMNRRGNMEDNGLRNFLSLETVLYRLHQITADCDHKVTALAAELVEPHHGIGDELTLSVADSQHLLRVKVLNVINVLCVFYPLAPNAQ
jgi:AcrR family transcriptional regulator